MPKYAGLFRKMPVNASGMDFTHKYRHFPNPGFGPKMELNDPGKRVMDYIEIDR